MLEVLNAHVPQSAVEYCLSLYERYPFTFKLTSSRKTKSGDYTYIPQEQTHRISVNKDLNPYSFLITYIHEVAHLTAFEHHGRRIAPHGKEWKKEFRNLMLPLLHPGVFPEHVLKVLARHLRNPKASSFSDQHLVRSLRIYDSTPSDQVSLESIPNGSRFSLNGKSFEKLETRRTRAVCQLVSTKRKYLVSKVALVQPEDQGFFDRSQ